MLSPQILLLRAGQSTAVAHRISKALQLTEGRCLSKLSLRNRSFSVSYYQLLTNTQRYAAVSSHEVPTFTMAKTARNDSVLKPGSNFSFHEVPPCLTPSGWTNDPLELEYFLEMKLYEYYTSFPTTVSPVLAYTENMVWHSFLLCEGSGLLDLDFYLVTFNQKVYRLDTRIELMPLLVCMREGTVNAPVKNGEMPLVLKTLLEHPELDWHLLGPDEWTDKRKSLERLLTTRNTGEDVRQFAKERAVLKNSREDYVNWVGMCVMARAEKHWEEIKELLQRKECPIQSTGWDGGVKLAAAWKEYAESCWKRVRPVRAKGSNLAENEMKGYEVVAGRASSLRKLIRPKAVFRER